MLEAPSQRSRKQPSSLTDTKSSNGINNAIVMKEKSSILIPNDSGTSLSSSLENPKNASDEGSTIASRTEEEGEEGELEEGESDMEMREPSSYEKQNANTASNIKKNNNQRQISAIRPNASQETLNGKELKRSRQKALDDKNEDEDLNKESKATEALEDAEEGAIDEEEDNENGREGEEEEEGEIVDEKEDAADAQEEQVDTIDDASTQQSEDHDDDGDVVMAEEEEGEGEEEVEEGVEEEVEEADEGAEEGEQERGEESVTPLAHTEDEEESHMDDEEEGDVEEEEEGDDEAENKDDHEEPRQPSKPESKEPASYTQKPTLNRPAQLMEEELKDSGDELSDLSEFDDTDDSDEDETDKHSTSSGNKSKTSGANSSSATTTNTVTNSRPSLVGRKRSFREQSMELKEQEGKLKEATDVETNNQHSDKESGSEALEEEEAEEEKVEGDDDAEEEDLEKRQRHMDALEALTTIEVEFATLRDKMYDERMLELEKETEMINDGTHPELSRKMKEIEEKREQRLRIAKAWRTHMGEIAQCEFEIKEYQAHCTYQSKKRELRNDIATETGRKMRKVQLDLDFSSESRRRKLYADKVSLLRSRKQRRAEVYELWAINEHIGFPCSTKLRAISSTELDEDFDSMGLPRPSLEQPSTSDYAPQYQHPHHQHQQDQQYPNRSSQSSMSSPRPNTGAPITAVDYGGHAAQATAAQRWNASTDYTPTLHHNNEHFGIYRKPMRT